MMHPQRRRRATAIASVLFASCQGALDAPYLPSSLPLAEQTLAAGQAARRVATIRSYYDSARVDIPATVRAGTPVTIGVTTYGGGCIAEDTTIATVAGTHAEIVPYQRVYTPRSDEACTADLRITPRPVRVTFTGVGTAQIVVIGRAQPGDSLVRVERKIALQ